MIPAIASVMPIFTTILFPLNKEKCRQRRRSRCRRGTLGINYFKEVTVRPWTGNGFETHH
jgi:hypothetical protein